MAIPTADSFNPKDYVIVNNKIIRYVGSDADIALPQSIVEIGDNAFAATAIKSIVVPSSVKKIASAAFLQCTQLTSVTLNEGLTEIGANAFDGCTALKNVIMPQSVKTLGESAFRNCSSLVFISFAEGLTYVPERICENCTSLISVNLPDAATTIGKHAFQNCSTLSTIVIPDKVVDILDEAFWGTKLTSITLPKTVDWNTELYPTKYVEKTCVVSKK